MKNLAAEISKVFNTCTYIRIKVKLSEYLYEEKLLSIEFYSYTMCLAPLSINIGSIFAIKMLQIWTDQILIFIYKKV